MVFPTKDDHVGVFWGTTILGNTHICPTILGTKGLTCRWYFWIYLVARLIQHTAKNTGEYYLPSDSIDHKECKTISNIGSTTALYYYNMKMYDH